MNSSTNAHRAGFLLIADDEPANLSALFSLLSRERFELAIANDGETVLELVHQEEPELVLLDVHMPPGMDGFETCKQLKASAATRDIPVLFMTSLDDRASRLRAFELGAADFISKPFDETELLARIRAHASLRQMARALADKNRQLQEQIEKLTSAEAKLAEHARQIQRHSTQLEQVNEQLEQRTRELALVNDQLAHELQRRTQEQIEKLALQDEVIRVQHRRLLELSVPLIPVTERIFVMPLIGGMDAERAERLSDTALHGAKLRGTQCVIIDATGLTGADALVPETLLRVSRGLRLLGAQTILTGLRADAARMFTTLGVSLGEIVTKATLQEGIAHALRISKQAEAKASIPLNRAHREGFAFKGG